MTDNHVNERKRKISFAENGTDLATDITDDKTKNAEMCASPLKKRKIKTENESLNELPNLTSPLISPVTMMQNIEIESIQPQPQSTIPFDADSYFRYNGAGDFNVINGKFERISLFIKEGTQNEFDLEADESLFTDWWENEKNFGNLNTMHQSMKTKLKNTQRLLTKKQAKISKIEQLKRERDDQTEENVIKIESKLNEIVIKLE